MRYINMVKHPEITQQFVMPLWHEKATEVIDDYFSPNAEIRTTFLEGVGPEILKQSVHYTFEAFPELNFKIDEVLEHKNKLIYRWQAAAEHQGSILDIPATGQPIHFAGVVYGEVENNLITRYHSFSNLPQVLKSLYTPHPLAAFPQNNSVLIEIKKAMDYLLSKREIECLRFWLQGYSLKETAKRLGGISHRTVQSFREKIKWKLNLHDTHEIISYLTNRGILYLFLSPNP